MLTTFSGRRAGAVGAANTAFPSGFDGGFGLGFGFGFDVIRWYPAVVRAGLDDRPGVRLRGSGSGRWQAVPAPTSRSPSSGFMTDRFKRAVGVAGRPSGSGSGSAGGGGSGGGWCDGSGLRMFGRVISKLPARRFRPPLVSWMVRRPFRNDRFHGLVVEPEVEGVSHFVPYCQRPGSVRRSDVCETAVVAPVGVEPQVNPAVRGRQGSGGEWSASGLRGVPRCAVPATGSAGCRLGVLGLALFQPPS